MRLRDSKVLARTTLLGAVMAAALAAEAAAAPCAEVQIRRAPETATAGEVMAAVGVIENCGPRPLVVQVIWTLVDEAGDRTPLRRSPIRVPAGERVRFRHRMLVDEDVAPGDYGLVLVAKRRKVLATDSVALEVLAGEAESE